MPRGQQGLEHTVWAGECLAEGLSWATVLVDSRSLNGAGKLWLGLLGAAGHPGARTVPHWVQYCRLPVATHGGLSGPHGCCALQSRMHVVALSSAKADIDLLCSILGSEVSRNACQAGTLCAVGRLCDEKLSGC